MNPHEPKQEDNKPAMSPGNFREADRSIIFWQRQNYEWCDITIDLNYMPFIGTKIIDYV